MKKILFGLLLLLNLISVSAYHTYSSGGYAIPTDVHPYPPTLDIWNSIVPPQSDLNIWHKSQGQITEPTRWISGKHYLPTGIGIVKPLDIRHRAAAKEGYTAEYGVERQTIVPWTLHQNK